MAREMGFNNHSLVQQIERGKRCIPQDKIALFAKTYKVELDTLTKMCETWRTQERKCGGVKDEDFNFARILPWIASASPSRLLKSDLVKIQHFVENLDVLATENLIRAYVEILTNQHNEPL